MTMNYSYCQELLVDQLLFGAYCLHCKQQRIACLLKTILSEMNECHQIL